MKAVVKLGMVAALCLALWPALAGAETPAPKGSQVFADDFSDPQKSNLDDNLEATDYSRGFHAPGVYHLILFQNNDTRWSIFPGQAYSSFTFELDVWDNSDDFAGSVSQGVVFRATDNDHFYSVQLDPRGGRYTVLKHDGPNSWSEIIPWTESPLVNLRKEVNRLRVDGEGDQFTIYLNGEMLDSFRDSSFAKGGLGMIASNVDAVRPHLHFDNVVIYTTDSAPTTLPRTGPAPASLSPLLLVIAASLLGLGALLHWRGRRI